MSVSCPHCKAGLSAKELKPGRYRPTCLRCSSPFVLDVRWVVSAPGQVAEDDTGPEKTTVRPHVARADDGDRETTTVRAPLPPGRGSPAAPPGRMTGRTPDPLRTVARDPGAFPGSRGPVGHPGETVVRPSADATGDFSEAPPAPPAPHPADATGEFTDAEPAPPPAAPHPADATGEFTDAPPGPEATSAGPSGDDAFSTGGPAGAAAAAMRVRSPAAAGAVDADTPARLGGYEVLKVLGKGGMGAVLLGRQVSLDRKVALKVMHPRIAQNPTFVARFTREAYAAAQLTHHNVIQIYDIGEDGGQHFFSMEFVAGKSLGDVLKADGKVAPEVAVGYVLQAARGLRYGHLQGMVHRDVKPDNLMVNDQGVVKVADLGLVKLPAGNLPEQAGAVPAGGDDEGGAGLTRAGAVMGTPAYMPPEQGRDSAGVDQRADIYSLGCTLYVLLTGRPPFEGKTAFEVITKHQTAALVPPEVVVKRVPKALSAILLKMMAKRPEDRHQSMDEVIAALEGFLGVERAGAFNPTEGQADDLEKAACQFNVRSKGRRKTVLAGAFVAACLLGVVGGAIGGLTALAGGLLGLLVMTPASYFVAHGVLTGGVVFARARAVVFGLRFFDWLMGVGGGLLALATLYLFGLLWAWLGFALLAVGLGWLLWVLTDRPQAAARVQPVADARGLFRAMRLRGIEEDAVRQFACKFTGANWEPFFEALFGYEAKLAARAYRKGNTGEESPRAGAWREPVVGWLDGRLEARRLAGERKHLKNVEAKALEAEGVGRADAAAQAEAMAEELVGQAAAAKQARNDGNEAGVRAMIATARERRRPKPGYNLAGVKRRRLWVKDFLNDWLGRRLRLGLGAVVFAAGLLWMSQNDLVGRNNTLVKQLAGLEFESAGESLARATGRPLSVAVLPAAVTDPVHSYATPVTGLLLLLSGLLYYGWRPSAVAVPGAAVAVLGPALGVPEIGPLSPAALSLLAGAGLILGVGRLVRK